MAVVVGVVVTRRRMTMDPRATTMLMLMMIMMARRMVSNLDIYFVVGIVGSNRPGQEGYFVGGPYGPVVFYVERQLVSQ
jgi:hypothetical protein